MDPTAQDPSSALPSRDRTKTQGEEERARRQSRPVARESQTARHIEGPKYPTPSKDKGAASKTNVPFSRARDPNRTNRPISSEESIRARARSVSTSQFQGASPTGDRCVNVRSGRADNVSPNLVPTANQVGPNATTTPQQSLAFENIISGCIVTDNATQINIIFNNYPEESIRNCIKDLKCILDLKLTNPPSDKECIPDPKPTDPRSDREFTPDLKPTNPYHDKADIENRHGVVYDEHLYKVCEHKSYKRWKHADDVRLLWIYSHTKQNIDFQTMDFEKGDQGRIVAGVVSKDLEQSLVIRDNALSYMSCQTSKSSDLKLNDTTTILTDLMWLLSSAHESLAVSLEEAYKREGESMYTNTQASHTLASILMRWLNVTNVDRVYLVVGAIDQCYIERKNILDLIIDCCKDLAKVKWLITSDCDDFWVDYIQHKLGPNNPSFETIHLNERCETVPDPSSETTHLSKRSETVPNPSSEIIHLSERSETVHDPSFEVTHPNERSETVHDSPHKTIQLKKKIKMLHGSSAKMVHSYRRNQTGSTVKEKRRREQREGMEVLYKGTERTNKEVERWGEEGARVAEAYLDERKGEASDTISNNPVESGGEHLFEGGAGENALKKSGVSESEKEVNAERPKVSKILYERALLLCIVLLMFYYLSIYFY